MYIFFIYCKNILCFWLLFADALRQFFMLSARSWDISYIIYNLLFYTY